MKIAKPFLLFLTIWLFIPWTIGQILKNLEVYKYDLIVANEIIILVSSLVFISLSHHRIEYRFRISAKDIFRIVLFTLLLQGITVFALVILIIYSVPLPDFFPSESLMVVFIKYVVLVPVCEEFFLRGLVQSSFGLQRHISIRDIEISYSVLATSGMFAIMHIVPFDNTSLKNFLSTLGLGLVAGYYREKTGSIFSAIIAHSIYNFFGAFTAKALSVLIY